MKSLAWVFPCLAIAGEYFYEDNYYLDDYYEDDYPTEDSNKPTPFYELDRYNHNQTRGWEYWWSVYDTPEGNYDRADLNNWSESLNEVFFDLQDIMEDPEYLILDLREESDRTEKYANLSNSTFITDPVEGLNTTLKAELKLFDYIKVKTDPYSLVTSVAESYFAKPEHQSELVSFDNNLDNAIGENFKNTLRMENSGLRDQKILFLCESNWCSCRFAFAVWHGFNHVKVLDGTNWWLRALRSYNVKEAEKKRKYEEAKRAYIAKRMAAAKARGRKFILKNKTT